MAKSKKKGSGLSLNFKDVKVLKTPPEGTYLVRVTEAELTTSSNDNEMIKWEFEIASGKYEGQKFYYNTNTGKESLWKLREVLEAMGQEVPDGKMDIDLSELIGSECGVVVFHEVYEGKTRAKIADFLAADEVAAEDSDEEDSDEEDDSKAKGKGTKAGGKKDKKKAEEEEIDIDSLDEDELAELVSDKGLDIDLDDYSSIKKKRRAVSEALEESDEEEEEEETTKYSEDQIDDMSLEDIEDLNNDLGLDLDLEDLNAKKARKAVLKALKKKGLLED